MKMKILSGLLALCAGANAAAGPFAPAAGVTGTTAIAKNDTRINAWASGYLNYVPGTGSLDAAFKTPEKALGPAVGDSFDVVSLGNGGKITLTFSGTLFNGAGWDFAVFENSFSNTFLELAFVEVSSDGRHFFRFPNFSFTPSALSAFGTIDPTNIDGYGGKYRQGFGTPFDLDVFKNVSGIDVNRISHIRLVDVVGDGREFDNYPPSLNGPHPIFDPFPTTGSVGFDLEALAARHFNAAVVAPVPLPAALWLFGIAAPLLAARRRHLPFTHTL